MTSPFTLVPVMRAGSWFESAGWATCRGRSRAFSLFNSRLIGARFVRRVPR